MPPPGVRRPRCRDADRVGRGRWNRWADEAAAENPNPGYRTFQRLNRYEYERAVHDLLGLQVDAGDYLPLDTMSANFDNIADVQMLSATLLDGYLRRRHRGRPARRRQSRRGPEADDLLQVAGLTPSGERVEGAPYGTRGGFLGFCTNFPADGDYVLHDGVPATRPPAGAPLSGSDHPQRADRESPSTASRWRCSRWDQWLRTFRPQRRVSRGGGADLRPRGGRGGSPRCSSGSSKGRSRTCWAPHEWSIVDTEIGDLGYGRDRAAAHARLHRPTGPYDVGPACRRRRAGKRVFSPAARRPPATERPCAEEDRHAHRHAGPTAGR